MPELMIKTRTNGPHPMWQDEQVMLAFNDLRIHNVWAQDICLGRNFDEDNRRYIDKNLAEMFLGKWYQYRTERISKTAVRVSDQWSLESITKSDKPNEYGHVIYVGQFFRNRMAGTPERVFGSPGAEVWYHGEMRYTASEDAYIWNQIETMTPERKVDYGSYPKGTKGKYNNLIITVDDFDDATRHELEAVVMDDKVDPPVMTEMREHIVVWQDLPGLTGAIIDDVNKPDVEVDIRGLDTFIRADIVTKKALATEL